MLGIYELKGDNLKICFNKTQDRAGGARATDFVSSGEADSRNGFLIVLKRRKQ